jgi:N-acyl-D-amino-acid deacylase
MRLALALLAAALLSACASTTHQMAATFVIRGGTIYDGNGGAPYVGDVALRGDRIIYVGRRASPRGTTEIDARGLAVAPGFINMLSWANESLIIDGRGQSDIRQGVTLEVLGEGRSMGPLNPQMKAAAAELQSDLRYGIEWTTLGEYLEMLARRGVSPNVASFVGATTVRTHVLGETDVDPNPEQLLRMRALVREAMNEGAVGVSSALMYVPATFAETDELVALASEAGRCGGMYASHVRDEGAGLLRSIDELIEIQRRSGARAEIYHLKAAGLPNWQLMSAAVARLAEARAAGLPISADMYLYTASGTGLSSVLPRWVQEGGHAAMMSRLRDPEMRARAVAELRAAAGRRGADWSTVEPLVFRNPSLRRYAGQRVTAIAAERGTSPEQAVVDLVFEDDSRIGTLFHSTSEENIRLGLRQPWVSLASDAPATSTEPPFTNTPAHPRGYGNFARLLGRYVRDEGLLSLQEAIRRMTSLPASNLRITDRGTLRPGYFADMAIFDPRTITDLATYQEPHQYAVGMRHVFVNGVQVLRDGEHTGATPGRVVRGPGWRRCN